MRVALVTVGSRGDVQPFVALAGALSRAGADVTLAAPAMFQRLAAAHQVSFTGLPVDPIGMLRADLGQAWIGSGSDPRAFVRGLRDLADPIGEDLADAMIAVCERADVVVYATMAFPAWHIADARRIPAVQVSFAPLAPTSACPPLLVPALLDGVDTSQPGPLAALARTYNRTAHVAFQQALWLPLRRRINRWRSASLQAHPLGLWSPGLQVDRQGELLLHAFSRALVPPPADWGRHIVTTGSWFLDTPRAWRLPSALAQFLDGGPPPVVIGMGSMTARDPAALTDVVAEALRSAGTRGVLLSGWAGLGSDVDGDVQAADADLFVCREVPHELLFARAAAVVHHGGSGTTAAGLRAGCPTVVVPHFGDQPFWGRRVHAVGAGPPPIPRRELQVGRLAAAIQVAIRDRRIARQARRVAAHMRAEPGVALAAERVTRLAT